MGVVGGVPPEGAPAYQGEGAGLVGGQRRGEGEEGGGQAHCQVLGVHLQGGGEGSSLEAHRGKMRTQLPQRAMTNVR